MALAEAILACLTEGPRSGYDLARLFDTSIGFFWKASHQQIYRELTRLAGLGLIEAQDVAQAGRPDKRLHRLTLAGRRHLLAWSAKTVAPPPIRDPLLLQLYALGSVDRRALTQQLLRRQAHHAERLALYLKIKASHYTGRTLSLAEEGRAIGLEAGIAYEQAMVLWAARATERLIQAQARAAAGAEEGTPPPPAT